MGLNLTSGPTHLRVLPAVSGDGHAPANADSVGEVVLTDELSVTGQGKGSGGPQAGGRNRAQSSPPGLSVSQSVL